MIRIPHSIPAITVLAILLAGCSTQNEPTATPPPTTPTAIPTTATAISDEAEIRQICNKIVALGNSFDYDAARNLEAGQLAEAVNDPRFSLAGRDLVKAAGAGSVAQGPDTNIDIARAQLAVLDVCGDKYGDGPW